MWKKYFTLLIMILLTISFVSSCCALLDGDRNAIEFEMKAQEYYKKGDYNNAVTSYIKAGEAFEEIQQYDSAIENFNKAKEILPKLSKEIDSKVKIIKTKQAKSHR